MACGGRSEDSTSSGERFDATGGTIGISTDGSTAGRTSETGGQVSSGGSFDVGGVSPLSSTAPGTLPSDAGLSACGNGYLDPGEECDDGNHNSGDGCAADCKVDAWDPCVPHGCMPTIICGDARISASEACDDGNTTSRDGCSDTCFIEPGFYCPVPGGPCLSLTVPPGCGDGVIDSTVGESCDDGTLNGQPNHCAITCGRVGTCGNAIWEPWSGEKCDSQSNDGSYDGCEPNCTLAPYCGDGVTNGPEQCDLGPDNAALDNPQYGSCLVTCELGPHCGDGVRQGPEECDWGDKNNSVDYGTCGVHCKWNSWVQ
jgi:cysteine-rich repeat protein